MGRPTTYGFPGSATSPWNSWTTLFTASGFQPTVKSFQNPFVTTLHVQEGIQRSWDPHFSKKPLPTGIHPALCFPHQSDPPLKLNCLSPNTLLHFWPSCSIQIALLLWRVSALWEQGAGNGTQRHSVWLQLVSTYYEVVNFHFGQTGRSGAWERKPTSWFFACHSTMALKTEWWQTFIQHLQNWTWAAGSSMLLNCRKRLLTGWTWWV